MKIINTFTSTPTKIDYYYVGSPIYINGDYAAYSAAAFVIIAYKDIAIHNLGKLNKEYIDMLAANERPEGQYGFLFDRAIETKNKGLMLLNV